MIRMVRSFVFFLAAFTAAWLAAGCANPDQLAPGSARDAALQTFGIPTARYPLPNGGERLQYSRQPAGQQVYNVDLDAAGKVSSATQVLSESHFAKVPTGTWRTDDVLRQFGKPAYVSRVGNYVGDIWVYRYNDATVNRLFYVYVDPTGLVAKTSWGDEPQQERRERHELVKWPPVEHQHYT